MFRVVSLILARGTDREKEQELWVKPLHATCRVRVGTTDTHVLCDTFIGQYHLPPVEAEEPGTILDLGSNIGLTVAHYAVMYPDARILGVELDPETAALAERNVAPWMDRCTILSGAVSTKTGSGTFERITGEEWGFRLSDDPPTPDSIMVSTYCVSDLIARLGGSVDFVKVDIEGAEKDVLATNTEWAEQVKTLAVEIHPPASLDWCTTRLADLGFRVRRSDRHPAAVVAVR